jgi:hypothetical protein
MADDVARLLVQVSATTELLRSNLNKAEAAVASFERGTNKRLARVDAGFGKLGKSMGVVKTAAIGLIASLSIGAFTRIAKAGLDYAGSLGEVAQQLGVSTKFLQEFRFAATQNGASLEQADTALGKFSITLGKAFSGNKAAAESVTGLGLSLKELKAQSDSERFASVADAIGKIKDPAQKASAAIAIFGKGGLAIVPTLNLLGEGFRRAAADAEQFGLILSDSQIQSADKTADKIAQLQQALQTKIAGTVADNAEAIGVLANSLANLAAKAIQAFAAYSRLKNLGLFPGGKADVTSLLKTGTGRSDLMSTFMGNADKARAEARLRLSSADLRGGPTPSDRAFAAGKEAFAQRQIKAAAAVRRLDLQREAEAERANASSVGDMGGITPVKGGGAGRKGRDTSKDAERAAQAQARDDRQISRDIFQAQSAELQARQSLSTSATERLAIEHQLLDLETSARRADIEDEGRNRAQEFPLRKAQIEAQTEQLLLLNDRVDQARRAKLDQDEQMRLVDQENDILADRVDTYRSIQDVARTAADRAEIEENILALQQEIERATLEQLIATGRVTNATEARANLALRQKAEAVGSKRRNLGPLDSFLDGLPQTAGEINEALESIEVQGLRSLNDGITEAIVNGKSLGSVFKNVANSIISDLVRIAVQQAVIRPLGNALGSLFNIGASALGGAGGAGGVKSTGNILGRASGGPVNAGQPYIVGERRPELFVPNISGRIVPNIAGMGGQAINLTVNAPGATMETVAMIRRELANAAPMIVNAARNATQRDLTRQRL